MLNLLPRLVCWMVIAGVVAGCGGDPRLKNRPKVVKVSGIVLLNGSPVEGAAVSFLPQEQEMPSAYGLTNAKGEFKLGTFSADDGAVPGEHVIMIIKQEIEVPPGNPDDEDYIAVAAKPPKYIVPQKYSLPTTSGLTEYVSEKVENKFVFDLND